MPFWITREQASREMKHWLAVGLFRIIREGRRGEMNSTIDTKAAATRYLPICLERQLVLSKLITIRVTCSRRYRLTFALPLGSGNMFLTGMLKTIFFLLKTDDPGLKQLIAR